MSRENMVSGQLYNTRDPLQNGNMELWLDVEKLVSLVCGITPPTLGTFILKGLEASVPGYSENL